MNKKLISLLSSIGLLSAACIWGFAFVIVKDSLDYVPAIYMIAFRFSIAAIALAIVYAKKLHILNGKYWLHGALLGLYLYLAYAFQTIGCDYTTAGKNAFLTTIYVVLIPLFSWPLKRRRPELQVFGAALMAFIGIGLLALKNESNGFHMNLGDILTLICGIFYAIHILFTAKYDETQDPILLTVLQFVFAAVFAWICAPFMNGAFPIAAVKDSHVIFSMLYLGIFSTLIAFLLQNVCLKYVQSSLAALFLSMESVFGVLFSSFFLGERMTFRMIVGCILMFVAVTVAQTDFKALPLFNKTEKK